MKFPSLFWIMAGLTAFGIHMLLLIQINYSAVDTGVTAKENPKHIRFIATPESIFATTHRLKKVRPKEITGRSIKTKKTVSIQKFKSDNSSVKKISRLRTGKSIKVARPKQITARQVPTIKKLTSIEKKKRIIKANIPAKLPTVQTRKITRINAGIRPLRAKPKPYKKLNIRKISARDPGKSVQQKPAQQKKRKSRPPDANRLRKKRKTNRTSRSVTENKKRQKQRAGNRGRHPQKNRNAANQKTKRQKSKRQVSSRQLNRYAARVRARVLSRKPRALTGKGRVIISFGLSPSGRLRYARISRSSGNATLDRAALRAVKKAAPFPAAPQGTTSGKLVYAIGFSFR